MITVRCSNTVMEIDFGRFLFGDGEWIATVSGCDLFS